VRPSIPPDELQPQIHRFQFETANSRQLRMGHSTAARTIAAGACQCGSSPRPDNRHPLGEHGGQAWHRLPLWLSCRIYYHDKLVVESLRLSHRPASASHSCDRQLDTIVPREETCSESATCCPRAKKGTLVGLVVAWRNTLGHGMEQASAGEAEKWQVLADRAWELGAENPSARQQPPAKPN